MTGLGVGFYLLRPLVRGRRRRRTASPPLCVCRVSPRAQAHARLYFPKLSEEFSLSPQPRMMKRYNTGRPGVANARAAHLEL